MFIHFDLLCSAETQKRLYRIFRYKIGQWKASGVVERAVVTYHFDSLYVCLEIPAVKEPVDSKVELSQETVRQIPSSIMQCFDYICQENRIELRIFNYKSAIEQAKRDQEEKGTPYYDGATVEEILRFASTGTKIAFEVLDRMEKHEKAWNLDVELSEYVYSRLTDELGADYGWWKWTLHFVCNPLLMPEYFVMSPLGNRAVNAIIADP
jgi:hypothetical protein